MSALALFAVSTALLTITAQVAVLPPSAVLTVMVAEPAATAVTLPLASTVATDVLLLLQFIALSVALSGATVAVRVSVPPSVSSTDVLFKETLVTATVADVGGVSGSTGVVGSVGVVGTSGATGVSGSGSVGVTGVTGSVGVVGSVGVTGVSGSTGQVFPARWALLALQALLE